MDWRYLCVIGGLTLGQNAAAYDLLLNVNGAIAANGCQVSAASQNMTVAFGNVALKQFYATNIPWGKRQFIIELVNCGADASAVKVTFTGNTDPNNGTLLALNQESDEVATGVGIELLDMNSQSVPIGEQMASALPINASPGATNQFVFYAQYRSTGAVTEGVSNATANFVLEYQ
jgi:type 1 fimbria pilin